MQVKGREVTLSTQTQGVDLVRTFVLENDDLDPAELARRFLHEPVSSAEKLRFAQNSRLGDKRQTRTGG